MSLYSACIFSPKSTMQCQPAWERDLFFSIILQDWTVSGLGSLVACIAFHESYSTDNVNKNITCSKFAALISRLGCGASREILWGWLPSLYRWQGYKLGANKSNLVWWVCHRSYTRLVGQSYYHQGSQVALDLVAGIRIYGADVLAYAAQLQWVLVSPLCLLTLLNLSIMWLDSLRQSAGLL